MRPAPRFLIADDSSIMASLLAAMLESGGYKNITIANNGTEALRLARGHRPDLALIDVTMPDMSGYDVARALRADPATAGLRIVIQTGRDKEAEEKNAYDAGADAIIGKPVDRQALLQMVAAQLAAGSYVRGR